MRRKVSLMLVMMLVVFSMVGCTKAKSDDNAKVENTTSTTQKTENVTKKDQATTEVKKDETTKSEESSSEVVASGEVKEDNNEVKPADNGNEVKEPEKSEEVKNEEVVTEPAATEPAKEEPTKADETKEEINFSNADDVTSTELYNDSDIAIANELVSNFGRRTFSKGDTFDLRDFCDWDSLSELTRTTLLTGIGNKIELDNQHRDMTNTVVTFNVFDQADIVFNVRKGRSGGYSLSCYVKR